MTLGTATPPRRARGAAIVIAMLLAALAAAVTVALAAGQERWRATVEHRRDQVQAEALAQAGVQWSLGVLDQAARDSPVDALTEPWALPLPPTPIGNGSVEGRIVDAQGLLNVNNLAVAGNAADVERLRLRALFAAVGAGDAAPVDAIASAVASAASNARAASDDAIYARASPPRLAPQAPLARTAELATIRGITPATMRAIEPWVAALPPPTTLNVNTAPPEVLQAALPGLDDDATTALVAGRTRKPFSTIAEFRARLPASAHVVDERTLDVASRYFLVTVDARQGDARVLARALVRRARPDPAAIVWQVIE
jgi:general secretion pathway protein K